MIPWMLGGIRYAYQTQPPAWAYPRILVGSGEFLKPEFVDKYQITHVINCADDYASPSWIRTLFKFNHAYTCLNAIDDIHVNILTWYPKFDAAMTEFLRAPGSKTIYVHCQCGINRSAFLALAYVCKHFGMQYDTVFQAMKSQRPCCLTNPTFMNQVREFTRKDDGHLQD